MPGMAARAAPQAAVEIEPADPDIGPGGSFELTLVIGLEHRAVAGVAAGGALGGVVQALIEPGIDLPDDFQGIGVLAAGILLDLVGVAARTVLGRDHAGDGHPVFGRAPLVVRALVLLVMLLRDVGIELLGLVAVDAGDVGRGMAAGRPVGEKPRGFDLVAFDAGLPCLLMPRSMRNSLTWGKFAWVLSASGGAAFLSWARAKSAEPKSRVNAAAIAGHRLALSMPLPPWLSSSIPTYPGRRSRACLHGERTVLAARRIAGQIGNRSQGLDNF